MQKKSEIINLISLLIKNSLWKFTKQTIHYKSANLPIKVNKGVDIINIKKIELFKKNFFFALFSLIKT